MDNKELNNYIMFLLTLLANWDNLTPIQQKAALSCTTIKNPNATLKNALMELITIVDVSNKHGSKLTLETIKVPKLLV